MRILAIGKLTPDSLAFIIAATDAMNLVSTTQHQSSGGSPHQTADSPRGGR